MTRPVTTTSRAGVETVDDAPRAQVGVGGEGRAETKLGGAADEVVALDVGDVHVEPEPLGQRADGGGQPGRVEPAGVGDDLHAVVQRRAEAFLELGEEGLGVAALRGLGAVAGQDQHRQFGEVVAGEVVEFAAGDHLPHGGVPVAVEARAVADPNWRHDSRSSHHRRRFNQPVGR